MTNLFYLTLPYFFRHVETTYEIVDSKENNSVLVLSDHTYMYYKNDLFFKIGHPRNAYIVSIKKFLSHYFPTDLSFYVSLTTGKIIMSRSVEFLFKSVDEV